KIGRYGHWHLISSKQINGRRLLLAQEVKRARQQDANRSAAAHCRHPGFIQIFDMIGGKTTVTAHKLRATKERKLLNVPFHRYVCRLCRAKYPLTLLKVKANAFAEQIDRLEQPLFPQLRNNDFTDLGNVALRIVAVLDGNGMCRQ